MYDDVRIGPQVDNSGGSQTTQRESGGNPNARNPNSSALGADQFLGSTWMDMVRKYRPDLMQGRSVDQVKDLRRNPEISAQMRDAYARENGQYLQQHGVNTNTPGTSYLAHFLGPEGALKAIQANPNTPMSQLFGNSVLSANPFLYKMTAGQMLPWAAGTLKPGALPSTNVGSAPQVASPQGAPQAPMVGGAPQRQTPQSAPQGGGASWAQIAQVYGIDPKLSPMQLQLPQAPQPSRITPQPPQLPPFGQFLKG